jgi:anti-sigma factor RsiW
MSSNDRELMRFHDGELSGADAEAVQRRLEHDAGARSKIRGLEQTGELVRAWAEHKSAGFDVADQVMARTFAPERRRTRSFDLWLPAGAAVALAAAITLLVLGRGAPDTSPVKSAALAPAAPLSPASLSPADAARPTLEPAVAIESVDFGEKQGTIFMVGSGSGETPVIWLTDPPQNRHRMPL